MDVSDEIAVYEQMLGTLDHLLEKAACQERAGGGEPDGLISATLAPGMFNLGQHVGLACSIASEFVERLKLDGQGPGAEAEEGEATIESLQRLIGRTRLRLDGLHAAPPTQEGATIKIETPTGQTFQMTDRQFVSDWSLPQFYFHIVIAYAILRAHGADLGIRDYLGHVARYMKH